MISGLIFDDSYFFLNQRPELELNLKVFLFVEKNSHIYLFLKLQFYDLILDFLLVFYWISERFYLILNYLAFL